MALSIGTLYNSFYFGVSEVSQFATAKRRSLYIQYSDSRAHQDPFLRQARSKMEKSSKQQRGWMEVGMCLRGDNASSF